MGPYWDVVGVVVVGIGQEVVGTARHQRKEEMLLDLVTAIGGWAWDAI